MKTKKSNLILWFQSLGPEGTQDIELLMIQGEPAFHETRKMFLSCERREKAVR